MSFGKVIAGGGAALALTAGGYAMHEGVLEPRHPQNAEGWQLPVAINKDALEAMVPTTVDPAAAYEALPPASNENIVLVHAAMRNLHDLECPKTTSGPDVMLVGDGKLMTPLCIDPKQASIQSKDGKSWLKIVAAIPTPENVFPIDTAKTFDSATDQQCKAAVRVLTFLSRELITRINEEAAKTSRFITQIVFDPGRISQCDEAPLVADPIVPEVTQ